MRRLRITVRGNGVELRGYLDLDLDGQVTQPLPQFAKAMEPFGIVVASPAADDYDPFTVAEQDAGQKMMAALAAVEQAWPSASNNVADWHPDDQATFRSYEGSFTERVAAIEGQRQARVAMAVVDALRA